MPAKNPPDYKFPQPTTPDTVNILWCVVREAELRKRSLRWHMIWSPTCEWSSEKDSFEQLARIYLRHGLPHSIFMEKQEQADGTTG